jgi:hypothetical protein
MLNEIGALLPLALFVCLQFQCWILPGGYSRLRTDGTGWRVISRDNALWIDRSADYARFGWSRVQGWQFNAFFGDPMVVPQQPTAWEQLGFAHYGTSQTNSRRIISYWPLAAIGVLLSIPSVVRSWRARTATARLSLREYAHLVLFVLLAISAVVGSLLFLWIVTLRGLLILLVLAAIGVSLYDRLFPIDRTHSTCKQCKYDLTGNESGICPECSTKIGPTC